MDRIVIITGIMCLTFVSLAGCETASRVADKSDPTTPVAPALQQVSYSEPGPQDPDAPVEFTTTSSGLKYRILRKGTGAQPGSADSVTANYRGWLDDGTEFDSSYQRGEPISFNLQQVIAGWTEGMQLVQQGGKIELEIPGDLGYGPRGSPPTIPPNATLHFIVELLDIN